MANISTLTVSLVADTAKFSNGLKKSRKDASNFSKGIKTAFKAAGVAAIAFGLAMGSLVKQSLALVDQQRKTARTLGTTQAIFAGLSLAAGIAGVSTESFTKALKRQAKSIVDANDGLQTQARAFERLNLDTRQLIKLPVEEQFKKITTALDGVENATLKVAIASDIFGAKNADLINILELGEAGLDSFIEKAKELGVALTEDQTAAIEAANDATLIFKTSIQGLGNQLAARFAPAIKDGAEALATFVTGITNSLPKMAAFLANLLGIERSFDRFTLADFNAEILVLQDELGDLSFTFKSLNRIRKQALDAGRDPSLIEKRLRAVNQEAQELSKRLQEAIERRETLLRKADPKTKKEEDGGDLFELFDLKAIRALKREVTPELAAFRKELEITRQFAAGIFQGTRTPIENFITQMKKARKALRLGEEAGGISPETFERFKEGLLDALVGTEDEFKDFADTVSTFAEQAARNMQDAFSDFFFSGFEDGLDGLVSSFSDTLRRMVSELIASDLLDLIKGVLTGGGGGGGGILGFFGSIFGRQIGGPVQRGRPVRVGESGPEIFTPGASGSVRPLGGINFAPVTNINGGAGLDLERLIPILEENNRKVKGEFVDELRRGQFA